VNERRRAFLGVAGVSTLVVLVAVASRANAPRLGEDAPAARPPAIISDYLATLALLAVPLGAVLVVWSLFMRRAAQGTTSSSWGSTVRSIALFGLLSALAFWAVGHFNPRDRPPRSSTVATQTATTGENVKKRPVPEGRQAQFRWLPLLVLGSVVLALVVTFALAAVRRRRSLPSGLPQLLLTEVLEESLDDLRHEPDPRRAVIRTYARMERTLGAHGLPRQPFEAPVEYLDRILDLVEASAHSVRRVTQLFERARFSEHAVDAQMKDEAIDALDALRAELAAATT
jgi:Domain of unknown function (DUF4129)